MSEPAKTPCRIQYTPRSSGDILTGEVQHVRGGGRAATIYSGIITAAPNLAAAPGALASGDVVFFYSGAGRLNAVTTLVGLLSGQGLTFFDTANGAASGGPIPTSGHKSLFRVPSYAEAINSFTNSGQLLTPTRFLVDAPFQSGLAAKVLSGAPAFTIEWTPEVSVAFPGT